MINGSIIRRDWLLLVPCCIGHVEFGLRLLLQSKNEGDVNIEESITHY